MNTKMSKPEMLAAINQQHGTLLELGLDGKDAVISLVKIAEITGRSHDDLLKRVRSFIDGQKLGSGPKNWGADSEQKPGGLRKNSESPFSYELTSYVNQQGKEQPTYNLNRAAFYQFVLSMTGKKVAAIRDSYIMAFDAFEQLALYEAHHEVADLRLKLAQKLDTEQLKAIAREMVWRKIIPSRCSRSDAYRWVKANCEDFQSYFRTMKEFNEALHHAGFIFSEKGSIWHETCGEDALKAGIVIEASLTKQGHKGSPHLTAYGILYIQKRASQLHSHYIKHR
ncbi:Rha family transcriptional regulator [Aeromonas jandaei]|uniref:Rha family transcriptional regulator n=1 Tax=Aeromonas jandaei TaxID=650 RepID=UPI001F389FB6|nr:Rha family transcriptional regulator [Aeromonas jandaei]MCF7717947.1 Rha family transcriptional regulator [Aeromonas jandaei]